MSWHCDDQVLEIRKRKHHGSDKSIAKYRLGADIKAEDFNGNTAAHLAAAQKEIAVLAELLKVKSLYLH